ncbi:hypothetical protein PAPHI01_0501 [Pancytospora philotis]|nr:hypothetical protein PAPHI01_0501 [Pancytospora philotis]
MLSEPESTSSSKRDENSLCTLTQRFIKLLRKAPDNLINISFAADVLCVGKRRIYDIVNVLEGLGMVSKWSVNGVKWAGPGFDEILSSDSNEEYYLEDAAKEQLCEEALLDCEIEELQDEIEKLSLDKVNVDNSFVTYDDLQGLEMFADRFVFALKAPLDSVMDYPKYDKGRYHVKISADDGKISVYYVNEM